MAKSKRFHQGSLSVVIARKPLIGYSVYIDTSGFTRDLSHAFARHVVGVSARKETFAII